MNYTYIYMLNKKINTNIKSHYVHINNIITFAKYYYY